MPARTLVAEMTYMDHQLQPEDLLNFVELRIFSRAWEKDLQLDDEATLTSLQIALMANPKGGQVIKGSEGLRKVRFAPDQWKSGKRGAARVLYVYFEDYDLILLVLAYRKNEMSTIEPEDLKVINAEIKRIKRVLDEGGSIE